MRKADIAWRVTRGLRHLPLFSKLLMLLTGAGLFFILFPYVLKYGIPVYGMLFVLLLIYGVLFRLVSGKRIFRVTILLWAGGSVIYIGIATVFILRGVQPLPYMRMSGPHLVFYYLSYPLRVLGIFFTGLIFAGVTSPVEFLHWGSVGLRIALLYRAFEYSVLSLEGIRKALVLQGEWPERRGGYRGVRKIRLFVRGAPVLVATIFRNIILWFPWAWICYTNLKKELTERGER